MARRDGLTVENGEFAAFARRVVRAHGRRCAGGDIEGLVQLVELRAEVDAAIAAAVTGLRDGQGYSWGDIGRVLGITRQGARQVYGRESG